MAASNNKYRKRSFLLLIFCIFFTKVSAQNIENPLSKFQKSVMSLVSSSPLSFGKDCKSKFFVLKVLIDKKSKKKEITISDSLDSLYKEYISANSSKIDIKALEEYAAQKKYTLTTFMLPFFYVVKGEDCPEPIADGTKLMYINRFNGMEFVGECIWLPTAGIRAKKSY